jgi:hypothetical protein
MVTQFFDSARWGLIPAGADAALYADGRYSLTQQQADAHPFGAVRWITVLGGASAAAHAGIADWESGNAVFTGDALRQWALARKAMDCRARVYCDRANLQDALNLVGDLPNVIFWLSTLDGKQWTAADLLADIDAVEHVVLPAERLWAIQWKGGPSAPFDQSVLCGAW